MDRGVGGQTHFQMNRKRERDGGGEVNERPKAEKQKAANNNNIEALSH